MHYLIFRQFLARKVTIINLGHTAKDAYECSLLKVTSDTLTRVLSEFKQDLFRAHVHFIQREENDFLEVKTQLVK